MDWTAGYASDVEYTAGFYPEQAPVFLNFASVINGVEPVDLSRPFTYFELGFGRGLTANVLAAANPLGRFYAADFNPAHVAGARQLAGAAGLDNLTLLENSFEELAAGAVPDLPQFDFITLHGIYTWVTAENRAHIVRFLGRYLKPGGLVYLSYNAMPGWTPALPLQKLIIEYADLHPGRSDAQIKGAREFIGAMGELKSGYLTSPLLEQRLTSLRTANPNYLVHEYMHKHWQPMYFADVARDLAGAKLDFVASAELSASYPALFLSAEKQALIARESDPVFTQTVYDYLLNTGFRKDVFARGARRMSPVRQAECMHRFGMVLTVERSAAKHVLKLPLGEFTGKPELYLPLFDILAEGPKTVAELSSMPPFAGLNVATIAQMLAFVVASGQASLFYIPDVPTPPGPAQRMNRALADSARFGEEYQALASPLLGNGLPSGTVERLVYLALTNKVPADDATALARAVWNAMAPLGQRVVKDGKTLQTADESLPEIKASVELVLRTRLPLWRKLGVI